MTDLAIREERGLTVAAPIAASTTFTRLNEWAQAAAAAHQMATSLVQTSFVPEAFRGKAHEATAAILAGAEIGLDPMAALRSFDIIQGTAAPRANTLRAVVQGRGHEMVVTESTATRAIVKGRRRGEQNWQQSVWTLDRATKMGLTGKHNWKVQPQAMLVARATAECARLIASDAILGIPYASEELDDEGVSTAEVVDEVKPARRTARRAQPAPAPATPAPEPDFDEPAEAPAPDDVEPITAPQQKKLHALLQERRLGNRDAGLDYISRTLGRDVTSTKEMSKQDAIRVIDDLEQAADPEPEFGDDWPQAADIPGGES